MWKIGFIHNKIKIKKPKIILEYIININKIVKITFKSSAANLELKINNGFCLQTHPIVDEHQFFLVLKIIF